MNARRTGTVSAATLSALALTLGLAHVFAPRWVERVGLDVWNYSALRDHQRACDAESARTDREREELQREIHFAERVAVRLADGSLTLAEAVEELAPLLRERPGFETAWQCIHRAPTFRHGVARYAILKVRVLLEADPTRWAVVSARLEAEYAALPCPAGDAARPVQN